MQTYSYENVEDDKQQYKQELGFRKMLYKYQHENEQLKNQIRALTDRLQQIIEEKDLEAVEKAGNTQKKAETAHEKYLKQQMNFYFKRIEQVNNQIKMHRDSVDTVKEEQYVRMTNLLKDKDSKLQELKNKLDKFKAEVAQQQQSVPQNDTVIDQTEQNYKNQLQQLKKKIRQLEKIRNNNLKNDINRHAFMVSLESRTRKINSGEFFKQMNQVEENSSPAKKGLWGLQLSPDNYRKISDELQQLKKEKTNLLQSIKIQNNGLKDRLAKLKNQYIDLSANNPQYSINIIKPKQSIIMTPRERAKDTLILPDLPNHLGNSAYERKNDKNYAPKKARIVQWNLNKGKKNVSGFSWSDQNIKSPITGINIWLDKILIGLQFIHTLGETTQHLHIQGGESSKKIIPILYRLNNNDYVENIILVISKNGGNQNNLGNHVVGIEFASKNGRKDSFGQKVGSQGTQKFDFGIKAPQKPIYSIGSFLINPGNHLSYINSLGFAII